MKYIKLYEELSLWTASLFALEGKLGFFLSEDKEMAIKQKIAIDKIIANQRLLIKPDFRNILPGERYYNISFLNDFTILDFWNLLPIIEEDDNETVEKTSLGPGHMSVKRTRFGIPIWGNNIFDGYDRNSRNDTRISFYFNEVEDKIYRFPVKNLNKNRTN